MFQQAQNIRKVFAYNGGVRLPTLVIKFTRLLHPIAIILYYMIFEVSV